MNIIRNIKVEYQKDLENKYAKNHKFKNLQKKFLDTDFFMEIGVDPYFGSFLLAHLYILKRANYETIFNILVSRFQDYEAVVLPQFVAMMDNDLFEVDFNIDTVISTVALSPAEEEEFYRYQYPLPMIVEPSELKTNMDMGYLTIKGSTILKDNHHEGDLNFDFINRANKIPLAFNNVIARNLRAKRKGIELKKEGESYADFKRRQKDYKNFLDSTAKSIGILTSYTERFYIPIRPDKRGRKYRQGFHINPQSTDWHKSVIEFADKEFLNE